MITTLSLPQEISSEAEVIAAARKTTFQALVIEGLPSVIKSQPAPAASKEALQRLRKGLPLGGGKPLTREESHAR